MSPQSVQSVEVAANAAVDGRPGKPGSSSVAPGTTASPAHALYAFDVLSHHLLEGSQPSLGTPTFDNATCPLFVSWHKRSSRAGPEGRLRGCIGTLEPRPLHAAVRDYALTSALRDRRFPPVEARELAALRCTVSLLSGFEPASAWDDWDIGTHGLVIEFADPHTGAHRTATFLPEVAAHEGWDKQQTLDHLIRKAGFGGTPLAVRASATLKVTRYRSTACSLTYAEYRQLKEEGEEESGMRDAQLRLPAQQPMLAVSAGQ